MREAWRAARSAPFSDKALFRKGEWRIALRDGLRACALVPRLTIARGPLDGTFVIMRAHIFEKECLLHDSRRGSDQRARHRCGGSQKDVQVHRQQRGSQQFDAWLSKEARICLRGGPVLSMPGRHIRPHHWHLPVRFFDMLSGTTLGVQAPWRCAALRSALCTVADLLLGSWYSPTARDASGWRRLEVV